MIIRDSRFNQTTVKFIQCFSFITTFCDTSFKYRYKKAQFIPKTNIFLPVNECILLIQLHVAAVSICEFLLLYILHHKVFFVF